MKFYCDIKVLPDPEASEPVLISNLMAKLHRALVALKEVNIGVSFPNVNKTLGDTLRLHGDEADLNKLFELNWLKGLRDYCTQTYISLVPESCQYCSVKRKQAKSANNKRKRSIAKGWLNAEEAALKIGNEQQKILRLPFVQLKSTSTGQVMKLFIEHSVLQDEAVEGTFNSYGLSSSATVPWF
ncbi:CRISPR-associated protein, Csy4 family [Moritella viscosa]|uniref:CRISPR-associated protein, Csy4 family n=1 Tax=Moritella viscosa TaxID=80854 RepID=A0A090II97_9GAMM|nr:type I-F CRISPR-associated endoribonuclease Cas6/Csy4 [Moritella viscosa]CED59794.1 CRISPR-associated protein, Csy4 [Moritella viscosa]SGY92471.1 CRISPR-associated protein, Csy4 family [Moritella viscosa]SHO02488.1 CRISPR-associated protein, Csy4 family [Moritella viscosa]SHO02625.1 CRISPR-associated protein, Csy4 family [Moritella viscosa]SHO03282.1 CRISPR-associated protein, Csy4 family [Moritella viscosa]